MLDNKNTLYKEVAERIISLIELGALKKGEKVPSIRQLSDQLKVSMNTVKEAYNYLEDNYYIEAIPQSGYYVRSLENDFQDAISKTDPKDFNPQQVSLCRIYSAFGKQGQTPPEVELGIAALGSDLWPINKLNHSYNEILRSQYKEAYGYCMPPGNQMLREQISLYSLRAGTIINPDEIIITSGCTEAIYLALSVLCRPGDTIAVQSPTYFNFFNLCEKLQLKIIEIPGSGEEGLSLEALKFVVDNYTINALFVVPNFNNPTCCCISEKNKKLITELMASQLIPIIEDDIFGELYFTNKRPTTCKSYDRTGNVVLCSSFSKVLAPGLRVGWIVPGRFYGQLEELKHLFNMGTAAMPQLAIANFLKKGSFHAHLKKIRHVLAEQIKAIRACVLEYFPAGTKVNEPEGGFVLWVELPEHIDTFKLYDLVVERNIMIAPGPLFSMKGKYSNFMRLNAGCWNIKIKDAIKLIGEILIKL